MVLETKTQPEVGPVDKIFGSMLDKALLQFRDDPERKESLDHLIREVYGHKKEFFSAEAGIDAQKLFETLSVGEKFKLLYKTMFASINFLGSLGEKAAAKDFQSILDTYADGKNSHGIVRDGNNLVALSGSGLFDFQKTLSGLANLASAFSGEKNGETETDLLLASGATYLIPADEELGLGRQELIKSLRAGAEKLSLEVNEVTPYELLGTGEKPAKGSITLVLVPDSSDEDLKDALASLYESGNNIWLSEKNAKMAKQALIDRNTSSTA